MSLASPAQQNAPASPRTTPRAGNIVRGGAPTPVSLPGRMIHLNGASSTGKTTLARALQTVLPDLYLCVGTDHFLPMFPHGDGRFDGFRWIRAEDGSLENIVAGRDAERLLYGMRRAVAAMVDSGNNLIVETGFWGDDLAACVTEWARFDPLEVSVCCSLPVAESREAERGNRVPGLARMQHRLIADSPGFGRVLDTSNRTAEECAGFIISLLGAAGR